MKTGRIVLIFLVLITSRLCAQTVREQIDTERQGLAFSDAKTLEKARAFILRDSNYYVGRMYYGAYLFFRADDKLGFTKAIDPLKKSLRLLEKDYDQKLKTRSNSYEIYSGVFRYHSDYGFIAGLLEECYQNVEMPDKALAVLQRMHSKNFQLEQNVTPYNTMAWIYHRNRVYTSKQFPFLKNSVKENVDMARKYLDSALLKFREDLSMNSGLFDPTFLNRQYLSTFHYKAMLYDYKLEIDSADMYYNELIRGGAYSPNNYAEFQLAMGHLGTSDEYFQEAANGEDVTEKRTKEYYYMRGTLDIYRGHPDAADTLLKKVLDQQGASPGFGWHSIGMARALHYEGLTAESQERIEKASRFQELHIGTTWGQEQYNLAVSSISYINQLQLEKEYFFENDQWWFWLNPVNWYEWLSFSLRIHHQKMLLASMVSENPERSQVLYTIFSSENLLSFDEVWSAIDGFGNEYFIKIYEDLLAKDKRPKLKKYFRLFLGKLYLAEGDKAKATTYFNDVLRDADPEPQYNVLLNARALEGLAMASGSDKAEEDYTRRLYETFPQLVPFTDLEMSFALKVDGNTENEIAQGTLKELKSCSINFSGNQNAPVVALHFNVVKDGISVAYSVTSGDGYHVIQEGVLQVPKEETEGSGKRLAYHLFGIHKTVKEKPDEPAQAPAKTPTVAS